MPIWKILLISIGIPIIIAITLFLVYLGVYKEILKERKNKRKTVDKDDGDMLEQRMLIKR